jgi:hypothetical protein
MHQSSQGEAAPNTNRRELALFGIYAVNRVAQVTMQPWHQKFAQPIYVFFIRVHLRLILFSPKCSILGMGLFRKKRMSTWI